MKIKATLISTSFVMLITASSFAHSKIIFEDTFEPGVPSINENGFSWTSNTRTSIVPSDTGNALQFLYRSGGGDNAHWSERRFDMAKYYPELWVGYWIKVPDNYVRGSGTNNKWFDVLTSTMSDYTNGSVTRVEMQDWPGSGNSINMNIQLRTNGSFQNSPRYAGFIKPSDAGKWMHIVFHLKTGANGTVKMYRKWEGADYELINQINTNIGGQGWRGGYLMGYANAAYSQDTKWLVDDFTLSDSPLLVAPKPPTFFPIQ